MLGYCFDLVTNLYQIPPRSFLTVQFTDGPNDVSKIFLDQNDANVSVTTFDGCGIFVGSFLFLFSTCLLFSVTSNFKIGAKLACPY